MSRGSLTSGMSTWPTPPHCGGRSAGHSPPLHHANHTSEHFGSRFPSFLGQFLTNVPLKLVNTVAYDSTNFFKNFQNFSLFITSQGGEVDLLWHPLSHLGDRRWRGVPLWHGSCDACGTGWSIGRRGATVAQSHVIT
jgi:hypothetical protein